MQFAAGWQFLIPIYNWKIIFFQRHEEKDKFQVLPARMEPVAEQNTISQALLPCFGKNIGGSAIKPVSFDEQHAYH